MPKEWRFSAGTLCGAASARGEEFAGIEDCGAFPTLLRPCRTVAARIRKMAYFMQTGTNGASATLSRLFN